MAKGKRIFDISQIHQQSKANFKKERMLMLKNILKLAVNSPQFYIISKFCLIT